MCNRILSYTLIRGHIRIYGLTLWSLLINLIRFAHGISRFAPFDASPRNNAFYHKTCLQRSLPELNCVSLTSMRVMTLCRQRHQQPNALLQQSYRRPRLTMTMTSKMTSKVKEAKIAWSTTLVVFSVPKLLTRIDQTWRLKTGWCWKCHSKIKPPVESQTETRTGEDGSQTGTNGSHRGSMGCRTRRTHRTKHHGPKTEYPQDGWPCKVLRRCKRAGPISGRVMLEFQLPRPPIPTRWTRSCHIRNLSSGRLE